MWRMWWETGSWELTQEIVQPTAAIDRTGVWLSDRNEAQKDRMGRDSGAWGDSGWGRVKVPGVSGIKGSGGNLGPLPTLAP